MTTTGSTPVLVEVLTFEGCPNAKPALTLVEDIATSLGVEIDLRPVDVPDLESAERERFPGSPTIRVQGRDIEPDRPTRQPRPRLPRLPHHQRNNHWRPTRQLGSQSTHSRHNLSLLSPARSARDTSPTVAQLQPRPCARPLKRHRARHPRHRLRGGDPRRDLRLLGHRDLGDRRGARPVAESVAARFLTSPS